MVASTAPVKKDLLEMARAFATVIYSSVGVYYTVNNCQPYSDLWERGGVSGGGNSNIQTSLTK